MGRSDMESVYKIPKVATATVSTKRLKMRRKLKKSRATRKRAAMMSAAAGGSGMSSGRRALFFFNVPGWVTEYEELIEVFRPFGVIAKMELFGSSAWNQWGVVDFRDAVADFARESLDAIMEVKVASKEKSEERRKDRLRTEWHRKREMIKRAKTTSEQKDRLPKTSLEQMERSAAAPQPSIEETTSLELGDAMELSACYDSEEDMLADNEYGEWDHFMERILLESATALATANIGNPHLVTPSPGGASAGTVAADRDWGRPVAS